MSEQPIVLACWGVFEVRMPQLSIATIHVVGMRECGAVARVSSPVIHVDGRTRCLKTASGETYYLVGKPGLKADAVALWPLWLMHWGASVRNDATRAMEDLFEHQASQYAH